MCFCALPRSEQLRWPGVWWAHCPRWALHLNHLLGPVAQFPRCTARARSQVYHVSPLGADLRLRPSWQMSNVQDPRKMWLVTGSLLTVWWRMPVSWTDIAPCFLALVVARLPLCLWWRVEGYVWSQLALLWYSLNPFLCEQVGLHLRAVREKVPFSAL